MFTEKSKTPQNAAAGPRRRGRPPGATPQGEAARARLFRVAIRQIARRGYEAATLRDIAAKAGVSVGLLYRYFPSKQAVVLALYEELSSSYADSANAMPAGSWRERFLFALRASLATLAPRRDVLSELVPVLVGDREQGLFAPRNTPSRERVQRVFMTAVTESNDAPGAAVGASLGRLLYLAHLLLLLAWLLDRSAGQRATEGMIGLLERALPLVAVAVRLPAVSGLISVADTLVRDGLFGERLGSSASSA